MMTVGQALVTHAGPYMLAAKAKALVQSEVSKGCMGDLMANPVALEPVYSPITVPKDILVLENKPGWVYEEPPSRENLVRFRVWMSSEQPFDWNCNELFIKQLRLVSNRVGLEIIGNQKNIRIFLLCHKQDSPVLKTAFSGKLKLCKLSRCTRDPFSDISPDAWQNIRFYDFYPGPPYSHLLTCPKELQDCPYECLIAAMANIPDPAIGIYQVLFQPTHSAHNWHRNVENLMDLEYIIKLVANVGHFQRNPLQAPSGDLRLMAGDVDTKAHNDKPFYAAAFRVAVLDNGRYSPQYLQALAVFSTLFQHGGKPIQVLTEENYKTILSPNQLQEMFQLGLTYRPGFLVNSAELTGLVHLPPVSIVEHLEVSMDTLDILTPVGEGLSEGTKIGTCQVADQEIPICIPQTEGIVHTYLIGSSGSGKSTTEEHMILGNIRNGQGVAVLDPHGDLSERLLALIPEEYVDKVIYFDPGDPYWVPIWNPLEKIPGQDIGRITDDVIGVFKSFVSGWGDRLEHIIRHCIFALLHLPHNTLLDVAHLLRAASRESEVNRKLFLDVLENEEARMFWEHDFTRYRPEDFAPPKHKLSKLLLGGTVSLMLSQPDSTFNFRRIMDDGMIFIGNLSKLGSEVRQVLGGFIVAVIHITTLGRSAIPENKRKLFQVYLDEMHLFVTDSLEEVITEAGKYGVGMTLAHQHMRQLSAEKAGAVGGIRTKIVFNLDERDAGHLAKNFMGMVKPDDIINLDKWEAVIRHGSHVAKFKTLPPLIIPENNFKDQIIANCRKRYYKPVPEVHQRIKFMNNYTDKLSKSIAGPVCDNEKIGPDVNLSYNDEL